MDIKPIETIYNGYRFRSRLEARWAVFFDAAGIKYQYEPEGFEHDGIKYLPDFYLPKEDVYCEVKANNYNDLKTMESIGRACSFVNWGGPIKELVFLSNIPVEIKDPGLWHFPAVAWMTRARVRCWWFFYDDYEGGVTGKISSNNTYPCPKDIKAMSDYVLRKGDFRERQEFFRKKMIYDDSLTFEEWKRCLYECQHDMNKRTFAAFDKARQARFEHGEMPA